MMFLITFSEDINCEDEIEFQLSCPIGSRAYGLHGYQQAEIEEETKLHSICLFCKNNLNISSLHSEMCVRNIDVANKLGTNYDLKTIPCYNLIIHNEDCNRLYTVSICTMDLKYKLDSNLSKPIEIQSNHECETQPKPNQQAVNMSCPNSATFKNTFSRITQFKNETGPYITVNSSCIICTEKANTGLSGRYEFTVCSTARPAQPNDEVKTDIYDWPSTKLDEEQRKQMCGYRLNKYHKHFLPENLIPCNYKVILL